MNVTVIKILILEDIIIQLLLKIEDQPSTRKIFLTNGIIIEEIMILENTKNILNLFETIINKKIGIDFCQVISNKT